MLCENRNTSCSMAAIWERRLSRFQARTSTRSTSTAPSSGSKMRFTRRVRVVLPEPVWPTMATVSPGSTAKLTPESTGAPL